MKTTYQFLARSENLKIQNLNFKQDPKIQNLHYKQDSRMTKDQHLAAIESKIHLQNLNLHY